MHDTLVRVYLMKAMCEVHRGLRVRVGGLSHSDNTDYVDHLSLNNQEAVVVNLESELVEIRMETGELRGKIIKRFSPYFLTPVDIFRKAELLEEGTPC